MTDMTENGPGAKLRLRKQWWRGSVTWRGGSALARRTRWAALIATLCPTYADSWH